LEKQGKKPAFNCVTTALLNFSGKQLTSLFAVA